MARKHSPNWFRTATLKDLRKHHAHSLMYDNHTTKEIMIQSFLNPDPHVFKFCVEHYSDTTCQENIHHNTWSHAAKKASEEHRAHYVALFQKMGLKNQKDILYSSIETKDHELTELFTDLLSAYISPPHLLRHAVVHKNTKMAKLYMNAYPESIVEADCMLMHSSYSKIHAYWHKIHAEYQKKILTSEIGSSAGKIQVKKISKI